MESPAANILTREELFKLVWLEPASKIAALYNIPYSDFKKICDDMQVPIPGSGYWSKLRAGKAVPASMLPTDYLGKNEVTIAAKKPEKKIVLAANLPKEAVTAFEKLLTVPAKLTNPDPLIISIKEKLEKPKYLHDGLAWHGPGNINISVAPKNALRALCFMDTLIKVLKARGHSLKVENNITFALIEGEKINIRLREKANRTIVKEGNWDRAVDTPSGIFLVSAGTSSWDNKEWKDGKLLIEDRLEDIIAYLEEKANKEKEWRRQSEIAAAEQREKERIQRELEQNQEKELARFKGLLQDAKRWKEVKMLREYIADMKNIAASAPTMSEERTAWIEWASKKADWYDPLVNLPDELVSNVDKETLILKKRQSYYSW